MRTTAVDDSGETQFKPVITGGELARSLPLKAYLHILAINDCSAGALAFTLRSADRKKADIKIVGRRFDRTKLVDAKITSCFIAPGKFDLFGVGKKASVYCL